ncbi:hypothetical protein PP639_gp075 [Arthrobacter phage Seahorse]|uniref:Uncharacterized protein n=1 Tax=Arthrobacter phage Seahorse TaxID=2419611 RepID=A0A3G3M554_9CAUD|nr:hypothetical protein PP639_gp075 [Arthrobacter phage Seahorse]AYR01575.1 hypothetical protein PBI_SEAHORSE_75 [Arthrobacter phage Seahorse]
MNEDEAAVTLVAAPLERTTRQHGPFGAVLRVGTGRVHLHITPEMAANWLPVLTEIAQEGS